jgi:metal-responsive CopG/Arc/MetJ family transcriptional regulator
MVTRGEKVNVLIPEGMISQVDEIMKKDASWISVQEFIRQAVAEKIERWKKEHAVG